MCGHNCISLRLFPRFTSFFVTGFLRIHIRALLSVYSHPFATFCVFTSVSYFLCIRIRALLSVYSHPCFTFCVLKSVLYFLRCVLVLKCWFGVSLMITVWASYCYTEKFTDVWSVLMGKQSTTLSVQGTLSLIPLLAGHGWLNLFSTIFYSVWIISRPNIHPFSSMVWALSSYTWCSHASVINRVDVLHLQLI
jgi:hypothetical protein